MQEILEIEKPLQFLQGELKERLQKVQRSWRWSFSFWTWILKCKQDSKLFQIIGNYFLTRVLRIKKTIEKGLIKRTKCTLSFELDSAIVWMLTALSITISTSHLFFHSRRNVGIECFCYRSLTNFYWSLTNFIPLISQLVYLSLWSYLSHSIGSFCSSKQGLILEDIIINSHFIGITSEIFSMVLMVPASLWRYLCTVIFISIYYAMYRPSDC